jgi:hypothetical protein
MKNVGPKHKAKELQKHDHCKQKNLIDNARVKKLKFLILFYIFDFRQKGAGMRWGRVFENFTPAKFACVYVG